MHPTNVIASQAQQAKPAQQPLRPWFDMLSHLYPPTGVLLVGAGSGSSPWVQHLMANTWPHVTLVEADEATAQRLMAATQNHPDWQVESKVVGPRSEATAFYSASLPTESGLLAPESLRGLWPNLKTTHQQTPHATTLAELQRDADSTASWLLVDCLPGLPIIRGAAQQLAGVDVIAVRVLLNESAPDANAHSNAITASGATAGQLQLALQALGFRCLAIEASRHPGIGHALFVRDIAAQASQLQRQLTRQAQTHQEQFQTQAKTLAQALAQAKTTADQLTAERQERLIEHAAQMQQLTQGKAAAEKLALERQQLVEQLQAQAKQATEAQTSATAAKAAAEATAISATKQTEERATQVQQLTQAKAATDKLAAERLAQIQALEQRQRQLQAHSAESARLRQHLKDELAKAETQITLLKDIFIQGTGQ